MVSTETKKKMMVITGAIFIVFALMNSFYAALLAIFGYYAIKKGKEKSQ